MSVTPETPQSREEQWLAVIAGIAGIEPEEPQSRIEKWLAYIAEHGLGTNEEREQLQVLYTPYKAMGGNHNAATLYEKVMEELPLEKQKDTR